jgi:hypothetical protein
MTGLGLAGLLVLGACTSDSNGSSETKPSAFSSEPPVASADVSLQGDAALVAALNKPDVRCGFPDVDGPSIALLSTPTGLVFRIKVQQDRVNVIVSDDAAPQNNQRQFEGTGVTDFDAANGAQVDSSLTETPVAGSSPGAIGQLTSIKASIDCAGQDPGTSTITLTGETPQGTLTNTALETPRVECNFPGNEVVLIGVVTVDGTKVFVDVGLRPDATSVNKTVGENKTAYKSPPGTATLTDNGARVNGDAAEQGVPTPRVLHVEGEAVCGTPVG